MNKRRKCTAKFARRMSEDHSRGFYLTECRDLIEVKIPGQAWVVQSSDGYCGKQYTVTRNLLGSPWPELCMTSCCSQCSKCPHQYTCTCPRYHQDELMSCKHTHAINQIVLSKQLADMNKQVQQEKVIEVKKEMKEGVIEVKKEVKEEVLEVEDESEKDVQSSMPKELTTPERQAMPASRQELVDEVNKKYKKLLESPLPSRWRPQQQIDYESGRPGRSLSPITSVLMNARADAERRKNRDAAADMPEFGVEVEVVESVADDFPDFSEPIGFRRFQLRVKGPRSNFSLFINAHALADLSPRFAEICFDEGFLEKKQVTIEDESYKDLLELMRCLFPCSSTTFQFKPVTVYNVALLCRLADKYQIAQLKYHCEKFLITDINWSQIEPDEVLQILISIANAGFSKWAIAAVIERAATYDFKTLNESRLAENLPPKVWSALLDAKTHYRPSRCIVTVKRQGHQFEVDYDGTPLISQEEYCYDHCAMCRQSTCVNCSNSYCLGEYDYDNSDDEPDEYDDDYDVLLGKCSSPESVPVTAARVNLALLD